MSFVITQEFKLELGPKATRGLLKFTKKSKDGQFMKLTRKDVEEIYRQMNKKFVSEGDKFYIKVNGPDNAFFTPKQFENPYLDMDQVEDYFEGDVKSISKFVEYFSVNVGYVKQK